MNLVYVCNEYPPDPHGGIGTFVQTIAHGMKRAGHSVTVVGTGAVPGESDDDGVRVVRLKRRHVPRLSWLVDRVMLYRWLRRETVQRDTDLVEIPDYAGMLPCPFPFCPVVVRLHLSSVTIARSEHQWPRRGVHLAEWLTLRWHRRWIAVSEYAMRLTTDTFGENAGETTVIYHPVAVPCRGPQQVDDLPDRFVLFAGYVDGRKGAYALAEAARLFLPLLPDLHVVLLGEPAFENGMRADDRIHRIVGPALSARVHCRGRVSRPAVLAAMRRAQVFAFPSRLETFGLVVVEAMLSGVPVITSTCDPFPEFVTDDQTGIMVPPDDHVALSNAVCRILNSPDLAVRLSTAARRMAADRFSLERCVGLSEHFYRRCIDSARQGYTPNRSTSAGHP
jgi:glycosyltransferase involved in cell wall biosynthesis